MISKPNELNEMTSQPDIEVPKHSLDIYQSVVEDYCFKELNISDIIENPGYKGEPFIELLRTLIFIIEDNDKEKINGVFKEAAKFDAMDIPPLAKMILYVGWCHASMWKGLKRQTEIILEKAIALNPKDAPPILLSSIKTTAAYASGSRPEYLEQLLIEYNKYGKTSRKYNRFIDDYVRINCGAGCGINKNENIIEKYKDKTTNGKSAQFYRFLNDLGTCDFNSIKTYHAQLEQNDIDLIVWQALYVLLITGELKTEITAEATSFSEFFNCILRTNYYLIHSNLEAANKELQKIKNGIWDHVSSNFLKYTQIRIELCNKNMEAAFQLLKTKLSNGDHHYIDDLFLARLELLRGNREKAFQYFRSSYQQCEHYNATNRFLVELDFSLELKPSDLFYLANNLDKNKLKESPKINYDEILNSEKIFGLNRLIGESESLKKIKANVIAYSATDLPLLIVGETGVGKDIIARAVHEESSRKSEPFLAINCGAITESLLQSELFGHLPGSYTGASSGSKGIFVEAGKGTVFLDEIGEISPAIQVALLRVLENNEVKPVGGSRQVAFQCRIIAATNADLKQLVIDKKFREDLFYRLKRLEIFVPPLRERRTDIIHLVNHFLKTFRHSNEAPALSQEFQIALQEYNWPGNIRQLKNEIEKMDLLQSRKSHYELSDCEFLVGIHKPITQKITDKKSEVLTEDFKEEALTAWRRLEKIKKLFVDHKDLTRKEVSQKMNISLATATNDLKKLVTENFILKVEPSTSPRSHYFIINPNLPKS